MTLKFEVEITVERVQGKFASKGDIADIISSALEEANPQTIDGVGADGVSEYTVEDWSVNDLTKY